MSEWAVYFGSAVLCSVAVKLLDDYLDRELDEVCGVYNWINRLGEGTVAYCLPLLAISIALQPAVGTGLFLASWAIGMYHDLNARFPSGLRGWQESLLALLLGWYFFGWQAMLWTLLLTGAIQLFDDIADQHQDQACGARNMACRLGILPCMVLCGILLLSSWFFAGQAFLPVLCGIAAVYAASAQWGRVIE